MPTIYQSLWMKPYFEARDHTDTRTESSRSMGGWLDKKYFYISWALSALKLREFYKEVVLICDSVAKEVLIDCLDLPYTDVICSLNHINNYDPSVWAAGKIIAYKQAKVPFIHVDGDLMIWEKLPAFSSKKSQLMFQNYEFDNSWRTFLEKAFPDLDYLPEELSELMSSKRNIVSINAGILGFNDADFLAEYTEKALQFIALNAGVLGKVHKGSFNMVFEQLLCYLIAEKRKVDMLPYFNFTPDTIPIDLFINRFVDVPSKVKYIHLMGDYKAQQLECYQMQLQLQYEYPAYYKRITELLASGCLV